jgi:hypothetical protein
MVEQEKNRGYSEASAERGQDGLYRQAEKLRVE